MNGKDDDGAAIILLVGIMLLGLTIGSISKGIQAIELALSPNFYSWEGTIKVSTLDYRPLAAFKEIPRYCRTSKTGEWDTILNYIEIVKQGSWHGSDDNRVGVNNTVEYIDTDLRIAEINGHEAGFGFTTNHHGQLIVWDESKYPSESIQTLFQQKVLKQNFRLRYLKIRLNGYNPESLTSTMQVQCVVVKNH